MNITESQVFLYRRDVFDKDITSDALLQIQNSYPKDGNILRMSSLEFLRHLSSQSIDLNNYWLRHGNVATMKRIFFVPGTLPSGEPLLCYKMNGGNTIYYYSSRMWDFGIADEKILTKIRPYRNLEHEIVCELYCNIQSFIQTRPSSEVWTRSAEIKDPETFERIMDTSYQSYTPEAPDKFIRVIRQMLKIAYTNCNYKFHTESFLQDIRKLQDSTFSFPFVWLINTNGSDLINMFEITWASDLKLKLESYKKKSVSVDCYYYNGRELNSIHERYLYEWIRNERDVFLPVKRQGV